MANAQVMTVFFAALQKRNPQTLKYRDVMYYLNTRLNKRYPLDRFSNWINGQSPVPSAVLEMARVEIIKGRFDKETAASLISDLGLGGG